MGSSAKFADKIDPLATNAAGELVLENVPVGTYTLSENGKTVNNDVYLTAASQEVTVLYNTTRL